MSEPKEKAIPRAIFGLVEYKLRNYKADRALINEVMGRQMDILQRGRQVDMGGGHGGDVSSSTERKAVAMVLEEEKATMAAPWVRGIERTYARLDPVDQKLVQLKYFDGFYNDKGIIKLLPVSERSYYRRRVAVVAEFAREFGLI